MGFVLSGWREAKSGGNANDATNDGAFYLNVNNASSSVNRNIARQLVFILDK